MPGGRCGVKNRANDSSKVWISLAEVEALEDTHGFSTGEGAFVNVLACGGTVSDVEQHIRDSLREYRFRVISLENTELWSQRTARSEVADELLELAEVAERTRCTQFGVFHTWDEEHRRG